MLSIHIYPDQKLKRQLSLQTNYSAMSTLHSVQVQTWLNTVLLQNTPYIRKHFTKKIHHGVFDLYSLVLI